MERPVSEVMVSICCITYNHEKYIAQAIEGFLMQKTNFKFEILIGEDCSSDQTLQILQKYERQNSSLIKIVTSEKNVGAIENNKRIVDIAAGKYVAFCEGDDFWMDDLKLQKQVDLLENNPDYIICCHYCKEIDCNGNDLYEPDQPVPLVYSYNDLVINKQAETSTASLMVNLQYIKDLYKHEWVLRCNAGDKFVKLFATFKSGKKIYVMPEVMSCYRKHPGGIWSMLHPDVMRQKQLNDFYLIINNFEHDFFQKISLMIFYIKRYFLFEIRKTKIGNAFQTIRSIYN